MVNHPSLNILFIVRCCNAQIFLDRAHKNTIEQTYDLQISEIMEDDDFDFIEEY